MGGRGAGSSIAKGGGRVNITDLQKQYDKLAREQMNLSRTMYLGNDAERARDRKKWNATNEKMIKINNAIKKEKLRQDDEWRKKHKEQVSKKPFVNSFGEATKRPITNATYEKAQNKLSKQIMKYIGG